MDQMTDKEVSEAVELAQTRYALAQTQARACRAEIALAEMAGQEQGDRIRSLMLEQEKRAKAAKEPKPADPLPAVDQPK